MIKWFALFLCFLPLAPQAQLTCFLDREHPMPNLPEETRKEFTVKWMKAREDYEKDTTNADALIWLGRRTAYLGKYQEAIGIFTRGLALHPADARLYRHRGHRYLSLRCLDLAITDFKKAARITRGKSDETEPDGLPNAKNIPTSTLQSNIWYHLGLAHFLKGEYRKALAAYKRCLAVSTNPDMYVATANWMNLVLQRLGKRKKARALYESIDPKAELIENKDYRNLVELYFRDKAPMQDLDRQVAGLAEKAGTVSAATQYFGMGYYCLLRGYREKAADFFQKTLDSHQWSSFGYIAAEAELAKMK